jgi:phospholipid-binding lipoprotein MlaA
VNHALQGNFDRAWTTTQRFAINSTIGGAGLFDVASDWDLPFQAADFGQTFGVWGIGPGPSVQLPLLGHSNLRDATGTAVGFVANPLGYIPGGVMQTIQLTGTGLGIVGQRASQLPITDELEKNSLDYYAALRAVQAQRRAAFIERGKAGGVPGSVDIGPVTPMREERPSAR